MKNSQPVLNRSVQGFALLEVVIAMFILAIGILGAGALQTVGMQTSQGAYYRSQAMLLAGDALDRMRANRTVASSYVGNTDTSTDPACLTSNDGCTLAELAVADLGQWGVQVLRSGLPGARGVISSPSTNRYVIRVTWNENEWQTGKYERLSTEKFYELNVALDNH